MRKSGRPRRFPNSRQDGDQDKPILCQATQVPESTNKEAGELFPKPQVRRAFLEPSIGSVDSSVSLIE